MSPVRVQDRVQILFYALFLKSFYKCKYVGVQENKSKGIIINYTLDTTERILQI